MKSFGIGKGLSNTQTKSSKGSTPPSGGCCTGAVARGDRKDPPTGTQFPGKGLSGTQTRNSLTTKR